MIISHKDRFIFLHIPKCAGTSFRTSLIKYHDDPNTFYYVRNIKGKIYDLCHLTLFELQDLFGIDYLQYTTLGIVRDPIERFISGYMEYVRHIKDYFRNERHIEIIPLILKLDEHSLSQDSRYIHLRHQTDFTHNNKNEQVLTHIYNIKQIDKINFECGQIKISNFKNHVNVKDESYKEYLKSLVFSDTRLICKLQQLYARDYTLLRKFLA
jgi:hypothetical protein